MSEIPALCHCGGARIHPEEAHEVRTEIVEGYEPVEGYVDEYVWCTICNRECLPGEDFA